jgi:PBSX family phage terminase large subunit
MGGIIEHGFYEQQRAFIFTDRHFAAFVGGIGSGKSYAGCFRALRFALGESAAPVPNLGMITAPTYPMLRDATLRTFIDLAGGHLAKFNKAEMLATLDNGSEILFRTADNPERLRGANLSWWYGDEAALYKYDVWRIMIGRLRQGGRRGAAWITTTPKGRNWLYREFVLKQRPDYALFHARTADNRFLDPEFVESLVSAYSGDFARQELDGEFVAYEGLIYPEFNREAHLVSATPPAFREVVAGVDWGYANPGVILVFGIDSDGRMWGIHEEVARHRRIEEWAGIAAQLAATYHISLFFCDPSEPDFIAAFRNNGCDAREANNKVIPGIHAVKNRLVARGDGSPRLLFDRSFVQLAAEMEQYQWLTQREGVRDQPRKAHDHTLDALRYAVVGVDEGAGGALHGGMTYASYTTLSGEY